MPPTAVLLSAGLDSAVLAAAEARANLVHPLYVSTGLAWERAELALQWQLFSGSPGTVYYAVPQQQTVQLILRVYL